MAVSASSSPRRSISLACELCRKLTTRLSIAIGIVLLLSSPVLWAAPPDDARGQEGALPASEHAQPEGNPKAAHPEGSEGTHEEGSVWGAVGKIVNFAILVGTLVYLLRGPVSGYLASRRAQVRADLDAAEAMKRSAAAQIAEMDAKLKALPGELEELRARGQAEIAAEEARIRELADTERVRLVEQARREIEQQVRMAQRALVEHAADLAVSVAETRIKRDITNDDQARLVTAYVSRVRDHA